VDWVIGVCGLILGALGFVLGEVRARRAERRAGRADDVSPWDEARWLSGDRFAVKNSSTRDVVVTSVQPDHVVTTEVVNNFLALQQFPYAVHAGDSLEFDTQARLTLPRPGAVIEWHFADNERTRSTRRIVTGLNPNDV